MEHDHIHYCLHKSKSTESSQFGFNSNKMNRLRAIGCYCDRVTRYIRFALAYEINKQRMATTQFKQNMLQSKVMMQKVSKAADYFNASMTTDVDERMRSPFDFGVNPNINVDEPAENPLMKGLGIFSMCNNIGAF